VNRAELAVDEGLAPCTQPQDECRQPTEKGF
jgi:hypothetical protein